MGSYALSDFTESLRAANISPLAIEKVVAAWGHSPEGGGSWDGGFIMKQKDGVYLTLTGWCDYTGWGCQEGAEVAVSDTEPSLDIPPRYEWNEKPDVDRDPIDLNRFLQGETIDPWEAVTY